MYVCMYGWMDGWMDVCACARAPVCVCTYVCIGPTRKSAEANFQEKFKITK